MLSSEQLATFKAAGHVTVPGLLNEVQIAAALRDIELWSQEFLSGLNEDQNQWFLESGGAAPVLRKLDNPAYHRDIFRQLATSSRLVSTVEQLIGKGVSVFFSQVFCKPPEVGGPKPVHQDNFYFGPDDEAATLTVWIALDDATVENGCLFYADGSNLDHVYHHVAPPMEPFNLQVDPDFISQYEMTPAPVPAGGVSFHHGNTWHQSSANTSDRPRRAIVFHYLRNDATLVQPALSYDQSIVIKAS